MKKARQTSKRAQILVETKFYKGHKVLLYDLGDDTPYYRIDMIDSKTGELVDSLFPRNGKPAYEAIEDRLRLKRQFTFKGGSHK